MCIQRWESNQAETEVDKYLAKIHLRLNSVTLYYSRMKPAFLVLLFVTSVSVTANLRDIHRLISHMPKSKCVFILYLNIHKWKAI